MEYVAGESSETVNEQETRPLVLNQGLHSDTSIVSNSTAGLSSALASNSSTSVDSYGASEPNQSTSVINQTVTAPALSATLPTSSTSVTNNSAVVPVISAIVQLPSNNAEPGLESSTGQTSQMTRVLEQHNNSLSEFRSPKRKRIFSPGKSNTHEGQKTAIDDQEEEEGDVS